MKSVIELRNKILHNEPDLLITEENIENAYLVSLSLPTLCIIQGSILYPNVFNAEGFDTTRFRELMIKNGQITK